MKIFLNLNENLGEKKRKNGFQNLYTIKVKMWMNVVWENEWTAISFLSLCFYASVFTTTIASSFQIFCISPFFSHSKHTRMLESYEQYLFSTCMWCSSNAYRPFMILFGSLCTAFSRFFPEFTLTCRNNRHSFAALMNVYVNFQI